MRRKIIDDIGFNICLIVHVCMYELYIVQLADGTVFHCPTWNTEHRTSRHEVSDCMGPPGVMVALVYKVLPGSKLKQNYLDINFSDPAVSLTPYSDI